MTFENIEERVSLVDLFDYDFFKEFVETYFVADPNDTYQFLRDWVGDFCIEKQLLREFASGLLETASLSPREFFEEMQSDPLFQDKLTVTNLGLELFTDTAVFSQENDAALFCVLDNSMYTTHASSLFSYIGKNHIAEVWNKEWGLIAALGESFIGFYKNILSGGYPFDLLPEVKEYYGNSEDFCGRKFYDLISNFSKVYAFKNF